MVQFTNNEESLLILVKFTKNSIWSIIRRDKVLRQSFSMLYFYDVLYIYIYEKSSKNTEGIDRVQTNQYYHNFYNVTCLKKLPKF